MSKKTYEAQLAKLDELRARGASPETVREIRKALANRSNYIVAKAAHIGAQFGATELIPDLLTAADRLFTEAVKSDPQCWGKNAVIQALADLGHDDPAVYLRGLRHVQMEPVWQGQQDSAGALRGKCALAVVGCRALTDHTVLACLVEVLADADRTVRVEAARAVGRMNRPEAALLLRLRALSGDDDPEVLGACFSGILAIEGEAGIEFVARFLERRDDSAREAALSLGLTHSERALEVLRNARERAHDASFADLLVTAIGLARLPQAFEHLIGLVKDEGSAAAVEALAEARVSQEVVTALQGAVEANGSTRLRTLFARRFGATPANA